MAGQPSTIVKLFLALGAAILLLNLTFVWLLSGSGGRSTPLAATEGRERLSSHDSYGGTTASKPVVWISAKKEVAMSHVAAVFDRLGYKERLPGQPWDVMWSHQYPFITYQEDLMHLAPQQRINHFPGTSCIVYKPKLTGHGFSFTPKSFKLPEEADRLLKEAEKSPDTLWIQKNNKHRGIKIKNLSAINLKDTGTFVQEFISNPLLIDGRKFDIGIYTVMTSVNPLRVYIYQEEILWRFCAKDYHPFDEADKKKYVVDDNYTPAWELPTIKLLEKEHGLSHREALNHILRKKGFSPGEVWSTCVKIIQEVMYHCEGAIYNHTLPYSSSRNFFEMFRFDFVLDENLKVWLMEVNLSPNLSSSHFEENRLLYEQVMYNTLSIAGVARNDNPTFKYNGRHHSIMLVNEADIQIVLPQCLDGTCSDCKLQICQLCKKCRSDALSFVLKTAFLEHVNRRNFRRLIPPPQSGYHDDASWSLPSDRHSALKISNELMEIWYKEKCCQHKTWC